MNYTMKTCVRCGKEFTNIKTHLSRKIACSATYVNVDRELIKSDYNKYFEEYQKMISESESKDDNLDEIDKKIMEIAVKEDIDIDEISSSSECEDNECEECVCDKCGKKYKNCRQHNCGDKIVLKSFGTEDFLEFDELKELTQYKVGDLLSMYVKVKHIDKEYNRNIYVKDRINCDIALFYIDGEWCYKLWKEQFPKIVRACLNDYQRYKQIYGQLSKKDDHYKLLCQIVDKLKRFYDDDRSELEDQDILDLELKIEVERQRLNKIKKKRNKNNVIKDKDVDLVNLNSKDQFLRNIISDYHIVKRELILKGVIQSRI